MDQIAAMLPPLPFDIPEHVKPLVRLSSPLRRDTVILLTAPLHPY